MAEKKQKEKKKKPSLKQGSYYKIEGEKISRSRKSCPKCGQGYFMAEHNNRLACGRCGYTEFRKKEKSGEKSAQA